MNEELLQQTIDALLANLPSFEVVNDTPYEERTGEMRLSEDQWMAISGSAAELAELLEVLQDEMKQMSEDNSQFGVGA